MKENSINSVFDGSPFMEVLNFKGEFIAPKKIIGENHYLDEKNFGPMSILEKTFYSLAIMKESEMNEIIELVLGKTVSEIRIIGEVDYYNERLNTSCTEEQKQIITKLGNDSKFFINQVWLSIYNRIPETNNIPDIQLSSNYEIIGGHNIETVLKKVFNSDNITVTKINNKVAGAIVVEKIFEDKLDKQIEVATLIMCPGCNQHGKIHLRGGQKSDELLTKNEAFEYLEKFKSYEDWISEDEYQKVKSEISTSNLC